MKKAIVTLTIGKKYIRNFRRFCDGPWKAYAQKHSLDLIVLTDSLDSTSRAQSRSPAWQKCLILSQREIQKYDQVAWVDSDILINPRSPNIFDNVPIEMIGAVDDYATPNKEDHEVGLERLYEHWSQNGIKFIRNLTATEYHKNFGLPGEYQSVVQTGVLVLSPKYHNDLFQHVYNEYDDKGPAYWNYEMRPLSYEILKHNLAYWLNPKFNMPWSYTKQFLYPFLNTQNTFIHILLKMSGLTLKASLTTKCATTAYLNNYFLHFAGSADEMKYVNQKITSIFQIGSSK